MKPFHLDEHPRLEPGFKVPDGYFDQVEDRVMQKIGSPQPKVVPLFQRFRPVILAAAAVLMLALAIPLLNRISQPAQLDQTTIENYLAYGSGINQFDLLTVLEPEDIEKMQVALPIEDEAIEDMLSANINLEHILTE